MAARMPSAPSSATMDTITGRRRDTRPASGATAAPAKGTANTSGNSDDKPAVVTNSTPHGPHPVAVERAVVPGDAHRDGQRHAVTATPMTMVVRPMFCSTGSATTPRAQLRRRQVAGRVEQHRRRRMVPVGEGQDQQVGGSLHERPPHDILIRLRLVNTANSPMPNSATPAR